MKKIFLSLLILTSCIAKSQNVDIDLLNFINSSQDKKNTDFIFRSISSTSYVFSITAPISVLSVGIIKKDKKIINKSCQMIAGIGVSMAFSVAIKHIVNRTRPYETYSFIHKKVNENSASFPSGHTTAAFETATSLSLNFPKWYVIVPSYVWAGAVGYSRMYLGVHYPSDVTAGILLGAGSAWLTWKINQKLQKRKEVKVVTE